jgi:hypothetical protein
VQKVSKTLPRNPPVCKHAQRRVNTDVHCASGNTTSPTNQLYFCAERKRIRENIGQPSVRWGWVLGHALMMATGIALLRWAWQKIHGQHRAGSGSPAHRQLSKADDEERQNFVQGDGERNAAWAVAPDSSSNGLYSGSQYGQQHNQQGSSDEKYEPMRYEQNLTKTPAAG